MSPADPNLAKLKLNRETQNFLLQLQARKWHIYCSTTVRLACLEILKGWFCKKNLHRTRNTLNSWWTFKLRLNKIPIISKNFVHECTSTPIPIRVCRIQLFFENYVRFMINVGSSLKRKIFQRNLCFWSLRADIEKSKN